MTPILEITKQQVKEWLETTTKENFSIRDCEDCPMAVFMREARGEVGKAKTYGFASANGGVPQWPSWVTDFIEQWDRIDRLNYSRLLTRGSKQQALELLAKINE